MPQMELVHTLRQYLKATPGAGPGVETDRQLLDRFVATGEQDAFAALIHRHGPLVLGVCRRILGHEQDAEDAFQAAFLVLARKSSTLPCRSSLRNWLFEVAYRTASRARADRARRHRHEQRAARERYTRPSTITWDELRGVLDEELYKLPVTYRAPLLLCFMEGKTQDEAAIELNCSSGSLRGRLHRGRQLLRRRLAGRGLNLSAALTTLLVASGPARATVSRLLDRTTHAAIEYAAGRSVAGLASSQALGLAKGAMTMTTTAKLLTTLTIVLTLGLVLVAGGWHGFPAQATRSLAEEAGARQGSTTATDGLEILHKLELARLEPGATIDLCNAAHVFEKIPAPFRGRFYTKRHGFQGILRFRVTQPQRVTMALYGDDWGGGGNPGGGWLEEVITREQLEKQGWKETARLRTREREGQHQEANWIVFERDCKAGESFAIRNHKYLAPFLIVDKAHRPMDVGAEKQPGPEEPKAPRPIREDEDILKYADRFALKVLVSDPPGTPLRRPRYGDVDLEKAEKELAHIPRPWTLAKIITIYKEELKKPPLQQKHRYHLQHVLAASRDPRAAVLLGEALEGDHPDLGAMEALRYYFIHPLAGQGGTEAQIEAVLKWWQANEKRLRAEAGNTEGSDKDPASALMYMVETMMAPAIPGSTGKGLTLEVECDKKYDYLLAEPIWIRCSLTNHSAEPITIPYMPGNHINSIILEATGPDGKKIEINYLERDSWGPQPVTIAPRQRLVQWYNLSNVLTIVAAGDYTLRVSFQSNGKSIDPKTRTWRTDHWKGKVTCPPFTVHLREPVQPVNKAALARLMKNAPPQSPYSYSLLANDQTRQDLIEKYTQSRYANYAQYEIGRSDLYRSGQGKVFARWAVERLSKVELKNYPALFQEECRFRLLQAHVAADSPAREIATRAQRFLERYPHSPYAHLLLQPEGKPIDLGKERVPVEMQPADNNPPGLFAIGVYVTRQNLTARGVYEWRLSGVIKNGYYQLVGRLPGTYPQGDRFEVDRFECRGQVITVGLKHLPSPRAKPTVPQQSVYLLADLPALRTPVSTAQVRIQSDSERAIPVLSCAIHDPPGGVLNDLYEKVGPNRYTRQFYTIKTKDVLLVVNGPKPKDNTPGEWFETSLKADYDLTTDQETWLLFRSREVKHADSLWVERIEREGNTFTVTATLATYTGIIDGKNPPSHLVVGVNLGKQQAGQYAVKWIMNHASFTKVGKQGWPEDAKPSATKPVEIKIPFRIKAAPKPGRTQ
jgi:RNA polymerase sigma factor (sigma-70 family)